MKIKFNNQELEVFKYQKFNYLISNAEVANGYGVKETVIRDHKSNHSDEFEENRHFVIVTQDNAQEFGITLSPKVRTKTFWTKMGVIRLGFFIKSERAKRFRDWAEELLISVKKENSNNQDEELTETYQSLEDEFSQWHKNDDFRKNKKEYVYLISDGEFIKIGFSSNVNSRLNQLQIGNARELSIIYKAIVDNPIEVELNLHKMFINKKMKGEWFNLNTNDINRILIILEKSLA